MLLHIGSTALVAFFYRYAHRQKRETLIVAALFCIAPTAGRSGFVGGCSQRRAVDFFSFWVLSAPIFATASPVAKLAYVFLAIALCSGALSKVSIVLLPLYCLLLIDWLRHRSVNPTTAYPMN